MKKKDESFRMVATQVYLFLLGFCTGCAFVYPKYFWWVPILAVVLLIIARKLLHIADRKEFQREHGIDEGIKLNGKKKANSNWR